MSLDKRQILSDGVALSLLSLLGWERGVVGSTYYKDREMCNIRDELLFLLLICM